jgi:hypothetical protein
MFFIFLCILLWALIAAHAPFDQFGWLMLVGTGWFCGFMDAKFFTKLDQAKNVEVLETQMLNHPEDNGNDASIFQS